jgi:soluble lytic murein transglycosylase-like protein
MFSRYKRGNFRYTSAIKILTVTIVRLYSIIAVSLLSLAQWGSLQASAEVYVLKGKRGVLTFTSQKPTEGTHFEVFKPARYPVSIYRSWGSSHWTAKPRKSDFDSLILDTAESFKLDPALVKAVVHVESAFNPTARSRKGAMGLMQLMPETAKRFGVWNAFHPEQNLTAGAKYLRWLLDRYKGDETKAVAAYNAGEGAVDDYGSIPPYAETRTYVQRVKQMRLAYQTFQSEKS